jgi:NTE family protein
MSLSISYFTPCTLTDPVAGTTSTIVDGGVLSNFPIEIFDRTGGQPFRWPTFGIRLFPDLPAGLGDLVPVLGLPTLPTVRLLQQVVGTALVGRDQTHLQRPSPSDAARGRWPSSAAVTERTARIEVSSGDPERRSRPPAGSGHSAAPSLMSRRARTGDDGDTGERQNRDDVPVMRPRPRPGAGLAPPAGAPVVPPGA